MTSLWDFCRTFKNQIYVLDLPQQRDFTVTNMANFTALIYGGIKIIIKVKRQW